MAAAHNQEQQQSEIKTLIIKGKEQGYLTYAEVNDHLPDDIVDPEQIEDIIGMINGMGIEVHEVAPDAETLLLSDATPTRTDDDTVAAEEAAAALSTATASSVAVSSSVATGVSGSIVSVSGATSCTSIPMSLIMPMMSSICSGSTMSSGR